MASAARRTHRPTLGGGGVLHSQKIAKTMGKRITDLSVGQGLSANLVTAAVVLSASRLGLPVSTTHVSCGLIFGIGLVNGKGSGRQWPRSWQSGC